jgi:hypothetical protein
VPVGWVGLTKYRFCDTSALPFSKKQAMYSYFSEPFTDIDHFPQELSQEQLCLLKDLCQPLLKLLRADIRQRYQQAYKGKGLWLLLNTLLRKETGNEILRCWIYVKGYHIVFKAPLMYQGSEISISLKWNFDNQVSLLKLTHISFGEEIRDTRELYNNLITYLNQFKDKCPEYSVYDLMTGSLEKYNLPIVTDRFYIND